MRPKPTIASTKKYGEENVKYVLDRVAKQKPTEVVVWFSGPDCGTGVEISHGVERVKAVGALFAAATDMWNA